MLEFEGLIGQSQVFGFVLGPDNAELEGVLGRDPTGLVGIERVGEFIVCFEGIIGLFKTVAELIGSSHIVQPVNSCLDALGCFQGRLGIIVQPIVIVVDDALQAHIATGLLTTLTIIGIKVVILLQVELLLRNMGVSDTEIGECRLAVDHVEIGFMECFLGDIHHLIILLMVVIDARQSDIVGGCTLAGEVTMHVVDALQIGLFKLIVHLEHAQEADVDRRGGVDAELAVVLLGILPLLLEDGLTLLTAFLAEGVKRLIGPCPIEGALIASLQGRLFQPDSDIHETLEAVGAVEAVHISAQAFQLGRSLLLSHRSEWHHQSEGQENGCQQPTHHIVCLLASFVELVENEIEGFEAD